MSRILGLVLALALTAGGALWLLFILALAEHRGGLTAAQQAEGARRPGSENLAALQAALNEARGLDQSGKESDCVDAHSAGETARRLVKLAARNILTGGRRSPNSRWPQALCLRGG